MLIISLLYQLFSAPLLSADLIDKQLDAPLLAHAKFLLSQVSKGVMSTIYSHDNVVDERSMRVNCYGFITHVINVCHPKAYKNLMEYMETLHDQGIPKSFDKQGLPSPENFFHIFKSLNEGSLESSCWEGIRDLSQLEEGDILVYMKEGYRGHESDGKQNHRTHIMLVSEVRTTPSGDIKLKVIDSAHEVHDQLTDTRHLLNFKNGLGEATLIIQKSGKYVSGDEGMQLYHLFWDEQSKKSIERMVFAGRLLPQAVD